MTTVTARNFGYEAEITNLAATAAGVPGAGASLGAFADARALEGGVRHRTIEEWRQEVREELADARNYIVWTIDAIRPWYESGEAWACAAYVQLMGCLVGVVQAWSALHTEPS